MPWLSAGYKSSCRLILAQSIDWPVNLQNVFTTTGETGVITVTIAPPARAWSQQMPCNLIVIPHVRRPERILMSKSNLEDGVADAIAATALISVVLVGLMIWLSGLPS
mgnify:CR=1 FL=1